MRGLIVDDLDFEVVVGAECIGPRRLVTPADVELLAGLAGRHVRVVQGVSRDTCLLSRCVLVLESSNHLKAITQQLGAVSLGLRESRFKINSGRIVRKRVRGTRTGERRRFAYQHISHIRADRNVAFGRSLPALDLRCTVPLVTDVEIAVTPPLGSLNDLGPGVTVTEKLEERIGDISASLEAVVEGLKGKLTSMMASAESGAVTLEEISLSFTLELQAEAGVLIAKGTAKTGISANLKWRKK
jgi:Trypsin-co-occurring domain 1